MARRNPNLRETSGRTAKHRRGDRSRPTPFAILGVPGTVLPADAHISVAEVLQTYHKSTSGDRSAVQRDQDDGGVEEVAQGTHATVAAGTVAILHWRQFNARGIPIEFYSHIHHSVELKNVQYRRHRVERERHQKVY